MNTRIIYTYTDLTGARVGASVILQGELTDSQKADLLARIGVGTEGFIPPEYGLRSLSRVPTAEEGLNFKLAEEMEAADSELASHIRCYEHPYHIVELVERTFDATTEKLTVGGFYFKLSRAGRK